MVTHFREYNSDQLEVQRSAGCGQIAGFGMQIRRNLRLTSCLRLA